jgi:hypothetical protein
MAIDWAAKEDAILTLVRNAIPNDVEAIWAGQRLAAPEADFVSLAKTTLTKRGGWVQVLEDMGRVGEEIEERHVTLYSQVVQILAFTHAPTGDTSPMALLGQIQSKIPLAQNEKLLKDAGLVAVRWDIQQVIPTLVGTEVEPRSALEITFALQDVESTFSTYIEKAEVEYQPPDD